MSACETTRKAVLHARKHREHVSCVARVDQSFVQRSVRLTCTNTGLIWRSKLAHVNGGQEAVKQMARSMYDAHLSCRVNVESVRQKRDSAEI
jgi:hypothetical protein